MQDMYVNREKCCPKRLRALLEVFSAACLGNDISIRSVVIPSHYLEAVSIKSGPLTPLEKLIIPQPGRLLRGDSRLGTANI